MREKICGIYKIVSPSGAIYIGQSRNILKRWVEYKNNKCPRQFRLHNSLIKYGVENHTFEIVKQCTIDDLNNLEIYYIKEFDSFDTLHGMNLTSGGCARREVSQATRDKISKLKKGKPVPEHVREKLRQYGLGKHRTEEEKQHLREINLGRKHPVPESERYKYKIAAEKRVKNPEWIKNVIKSKRNRYGIGFIKCKAFNKDGTFYKSFDNLYDAAEDINGRVERILGCLKNKQISHMGFLWVNEDDTRIPYIENKKILYKI